MSVEKAMGLGVSNIYLIFVDRSQKISLDSLNYTRLNKIIVEAVEQCGRSVNTDRKSVV